MSDVTISCGAVVYRFAPNLQILLVKQRQQDVAWGIPKGHTEPGETHMQTACREVREETGIKIQIVNRLPYVVLRKKKFEKVVVPYLAIQKCNSSPRCDHKHSEVADVRWFNVDSLPPIYAYQQSVINSALIMLNQ
jgi:8-oxo-dGTP pyrophosphatase MutT (NUDIX family)